MTIMVHAAAVVARADDVGDNLIIAKDPKMSSTEAMSAYMIFLKAENEMRQLVEMKHHS